jgi:valyl-tRNA synthetase
VTEEIYGKLPPEVTAEPSGSGAAPGSVEPDGTTGGAGLLITAPYPEYREDWADPKAEADFAFIQELVTQVRTLRSECTITPDKKVRLLVRLSGSGADAGDTIGSRQKSGGSAARTAFLRDNAGLVKLLAGIGDLEIQDASANSGLAGSEFTRPQGSIGLVGSVFEAFVYIAEAADLAALKQKFTRDIEKDGKFIAGLKAKLDNDNFVKNAPAELVAEQRVKLEEALKRTEKLGAYIRDLLAP